MPADCRYVNLLIYCWYAACVTHFIAFYENYTKFFWSIIFVIEKYITNYFILLYDFFSKPPLISAGIHKQWLLRVFSVEQRPSLWFYAARRPPQPYCLQGRQMRQVCKIHTTHRRTFFKLKPYKVFNLQYILYDCRTLIDTQRFYNSAKWNPLIQGYSVIACKPSSCVLCFHFNSAGAFLSAQ